MQPVSPPAPRHGGALGHAVVVATGAVLSALWGCAALSGWLPDLPPAAIIALTALPAAAAALIGWTFLLWTALPDHRGAGLLFAAAVAAPAAWWGPAWPDRGAPPADDDLVVMTWNVQRLWGLAGADDPALACVVRAVTQAAPDALVLQEVTPADVAALSAALGLSCSHATYRGADRPDTAGVAVCAAGPRWRLLDGETVAFEQRRDWRYVHATVSDGARRVAVLGVHLHPYRILSDPSDLLRKVSDRVPAVAAAQDAQTDALVAEWLRITDPTIIAGDFNSTRDTPFHARLRRHLVDAWERGAQGFKGTVEVLDLLPLRIDYIYASPRLPVVDAVIPDTTCSDHLPVIARLGVPG